jgi:hypothetical protein
MANIKLFLSLGSALLVVLFSQNKSYAISEPDYLAPSDRAKFKEYYQLLDKVLSPNGFDYGRVIVTPAFEPEYSISVYQRTNSQGATAGVAYVKADRNIWRSTDMAQERNRVPKAHRLDADLPTRTAELVRRVWLGMLTGNQSPRPDSGPRFVISDQTTAEFSLKVDGRVVHGENENISVKPLGGKLRDHMRLAWLLMDYAKAPPTERPRLIKQIDRLAESLLARLNRKT